MKRKLISLAIMTTVSAIPFVALQSTSSSNQALCYVTVHPHTMPGVVNDPKNGIGVETGEYHTHQNCI